MTLPSVQPLKVAITTGLRHLDFDRLAPGRQLRWGRCEFFLNPPRGTECDYWIVYSGSRDRDQLVCAPENTLFLAGEPPSKKVYPRGYYAQFHRVVSTHADDPHPRVTTSPLCLNWHAGLRREDNSYTYGYDELSAMTFPAKENRVSVVCSNLTTTAGQRARLAFLDALKQALGDDIIHFGRGFTPISDKMEAIRPYRFHLVLENSCLPNYWTEKLSDAYLGWAFPLYVGCPNLEESFPTDAFARLDVNDPGHAVSVIRRLLETPQGDAERSAISRARHMVLNDYNPFARYAHWADMFHRDLPKRPVTITSHKAYRTFPKGLIYRLKSRFRPDGW